MLEPEIQHSHFHDGELCQLLHALDQPMSEPVKKAIRKAVRGRVKRLGMKYDNDVSIVTSMHKQALTVFCSQLTNIASPTMTMIIIRPCILPASKSRA